MLRKLQNARQLAESRTVAAAPHTGCSLGRSRRTFPHPLLAPRHRSPNTPSPCRIRRRQMSNCDCAHWFKPPTRTLCRLALPGVAQVTIYGGDLPQTQVQLNLASTRSSADLALADVVEATRDLAVQRPRWCSGCLAGQESLLILPPTFSSRPVRIWNGHRCVQPPVRSASLGEVAEIRSGLSPAAPGVAVRLQCSSRLPWC